MTADNLQDLLKFEEGWDSYNAPAPNQLSIDNAKPVLNKVIAAGLTPMTLLPSADGGVGWWYVGSGVHRACFESLNTGEVYFILYDYHGETGVQTVYWPEDVSGQDCVIDVVKRFLEFGFAVAGFTHNRSF